MTDRTYPSARFGETLAAALGTGPGRSTLAVQRAEILAMAEKLGEGSSRRPPRRMPAWSLAFAAAVLLLASGLYLHSREPVLRATFGGEEVGEQRQLWAQQRAQMLTFSDGSEVLLNPDTRAQVSRITAERADLELKEGHIFASIHKGGPRTWTIAVGPYAVRVVGTRFSVDWQRQSRTLKVEVSEGRVRVSGGDLPANGVALDAGARLERRDRSGDDAPPATPPAALLEHDLAKSAAEPPSSPTSSDWLSHCMSSPKAAT